MIRDELIAKLETAEEGSRELDLFLRLECDPQDFDPPASAFVSYDGHEFCFDDGDHDHPQRGVWGNHVVPHYTTSLDAKLPGENIVYMEKQNDGSYYADHALKCGGLVAGTAKTEILARRAAGLRGIVG